MIEGYLIGSTREVDELISSTKEKGSSLFEFEQLVARYAANKDIYAYAIERAGVELQK